MLETLFLNHGHCAISWGKILFFWGIPFKGLLWILWQEITYLEQGDVLTCFATHTHRCVRHTANPTQNHISMLWRRCWPQIKSWERGDLSGGLSQSLVHLLNSRLFQFYQFCLIRLCIKEANGKIIIKKK